MTDGLSTLYQDLLDGSYDCVDRIVLNAYFRTRSARATPPAPKRRAPGVAAPAGKLDADRVAGVHDGDPADSDHDTGDLDLYDREGADQPDMRAP
jgi:hypothetical protein